MRKKVNQSDDPSLVLLENAAQVLKEFAYSHCGPDHERLFGLRSRWVPKVKKRWEVNLEAGYVINVNAGYQGNIPIAAVLKLLQTAIIIDVELHPAGSPKEYKVKIELETDRPGGQDPVLVISELAPANPRQLRKLLDSFVRRGILVKEGDQLRSGPDAATQTEHLARQDPGEQLAAVYEPSLVPSSLSIDVPDRTVSESLIAQIDLSAWVESFLRVSPDSRRVAYGVVEDNAALIVVDGKREKKYYDVDIPIFSPNSRRLAYRVQTGKKSLVVVDGNEEKQYDYVNIPIFSPDSQRVAYEAAVGDKWLVVVDGKEGKLYDGIVEGSLTFSPDSRRVAYGAAVGNKHLVIVDGNEGKGYNHLIKGSLVFSPDSQRIAYGVAAGRKRLVVIDGKEQKQYDDISRDSLIFSPDSRRVAYGAQTSNKQLVVVDGKEEQLYDGILPNHPLFSPDSQHVVYGAGMAAKWFIVVDGTESDQYDRVVFTSAGGRIIFEASTSFYYLALRASDVYLVRKRFK